MVSTEKRTRLIAGAFAAAAVAVPLHAATLTNDAGTQVTAQPGACLAWFSNRDDSKCLSYSNGNGVFIGTPQFDYCPGASANRDGCGLSTGPLIPGTTIERGIGTP